MWFWVCVQQFVVGVVVGEVVVVFGGVYDQFVGFDYFCGC